MLCNSVLSQSFEIIYYYHSFPPHILTIAMEWKQNSLISIPFNPGKMCFSVGKTCESIKTASSQDLVWNFVWTVLSYSLVEILLMSNWNQISLTAPWNYCPHCNCNSARKIELFSWTRSLCTNRFLMNNIGNFVKSFCISPSNN